MLCYHWLASVSVHRKSLSFCVSLSLFFNSTWLFCFSNEINVLLKKKCFSEDMMIPSYFSYLLLSNKSLQKFHGLHCLNLLFVTILWLALAAFLLISISLTSHTQEHLTLRSNSAKIILGNCQLAVSPGGLTS